MLSGALRISCRFENRKAQNRVTAFITTVLALMAVTAAADAQNLATLESIDIIGTFGPTEDTVGGAFVYNGFSYVVGQTNGAMPGQTYSGGLDAFVRKLDAAGNEVWTRQLGSAAVDSLNDLWVDSSENVYVAGTTSGALPGFPDGGGSDAFLRKYDVFGIEVWTQQFGTPQDDQGYAIFADASAVYIVGSTSGVLTPGGVDGPEHSGQRDAFVRKYDANGNELWTRQFGAPEHSVSNPGFFPGEEARDVIADGTGVYVAGSTFHGELVPGQSNGGWNAFMRKYDVGGNELWTRQLHGITPGSDDYATGIALQGTDLYVVGYTNGIMEGASAGAVDVYVRKYDTDGNADWTDQFGSPANEEATAIAADSSGPYVVGRTEGSLPGQSSLGGEGDAFIRRYDTAGSVVATLQFGTSLDDGAAGVGIEGAAVYVGGFTRGTLGASSDGASDAFLQKYSLSLGLLDWTHQFGGDPALLPDSLFNVATDTDGNVAIVGEVGGVLPGQTNKGGRDAFVRKYDASGAEIWTRQFGSVANDRAQGVTFDALGNIYVGGAVGAGLPGQPATGNAAFVRKYDPDGNELWTTQFQVWSGHTVVGLGLDSLGNLYAGGSTFGPSGFDCWVRKFDGTGGEVWTEIVSTAAWDWCFGLAVDDSGAYISGWEFGSLPGFVNAGGWDGFIRKFHPNGNEAWTDQFGTAGFDSLFGSSSDGTHVYVTGRSVDDVVLRKYTTGGDLVWTQQFGSGEENQGFWIDANAAAVYVAAFATTAGDGNASVYAFRPDGVALWSDQFGTPGGDWVNAVAVSGSNLYLTGVWDFPNDGFFARYHLEDANVDGVQDTIETAPGFFNDPASLPLPTSGSILDDDGLFAYVEDVPGFPDDGVTVWVGPGTSPSQRAQFNICGVKLKLTANSQAEFTCGSLIANVLGGITELLLNNDSMTVTIGEGTSARVTEVPGGTSAIQNLGGNDLTVTVVVEDATTGETTTTTVDIPDLATAGVTTTPEGNLAVENLGDVPLIVEITVEDVSGNTSTTTVEVEEGGDFGTPVFDGFHVPVANGVFNKINLGRTVPLKWRVTRHDGSPITTITSASLLVTPVSCEDGNGEVAWPDEEEDNIVGDGLQNLGDGEYQLNWKTKGQTGCQALLLRLPEWNIEATALFDFTD